MSDFFYTDKILPENTPSKNMCCQACLFGSLVGEPYCGNPSCECHQGEPHVEMELKCCDKCLQMTNHANGACLKCPPTEKKCTCSCHNIGFENACIRCECAPTEKHPDFCTASVREPSYMHHENCRHNTTEKNTWERRPYNQIDHAHCWESKKPPCGQRIEHLKCCLCELLNPKIKSLLATQHTTTKELYDKHRKEMYEEGKKHGIELGVATTKNKILEVIEALALMYDQYCQKGHDFMTAGENAETVLQQYGYRFDMAGRIKIWPDSTDLQTHIKDL